MRQSRARVRGLAYLKDDYALHAFILRTSTGPLRRFPATTNGLEGRPRVARTRRRHAPNGFIIMRVGSRYCRQLGRSIMLRIFRTARDLARTLANNLSSRLGTPLQVLNHHVSTPDFLNSEFKIERTSAPTRNVARLRCVRWQFRTSGLRVVWQILHILSRRE